jgi:hypothetical protein
VLENAYRRRDGGLILLNASPHLDGFKSDPRFQQLLQRIGLPQNRRHSPVKTMTAVKS